MVKTFSPKRPQSSPWGLVLASRIQDAWKGLGAPGLGDWDYIRDFRNDPVGTGIPDEIIRLEGDSSNNQIEEFEGENVFRFTGTGVYIWETLPTLQDMLIEMEFWASSQANNQSSGLMGRLRDTNNFEGYFFTSSDAGTNPQTLEYTNSSGSFISTSGDPIDVGPGKWVTYKVQIQGTTLSYKGWETGTEEPEGWAMEPTDSAHSEGKVGFRTTMGSTTYRCRVIRVKDLSEAE